MSIKCLEFALSLKVASYSQALIRSSRGGDRKEGRKEGGKVSVCVVTRTMGKSKRERPRRRLGYKAFKTERAE